MIDEQFDNEDKDAAARLKEERDRVLNSGYALTHIRVQKLNALAERLEAIMSNDDAFFQTESKMVNKLEKEVTKFSNAVIKEYRDTLSDIADELGARSKRQDNDSTGPNPIPISVLEAIELIYGDNTDNQ
jgi:hypothetical protein